MADKKFCFGLPGNPVSSYMQFDLLVKPLIYKLMGQEYRPVDIKMPMGIDYKRRDTLRRSYFPIIVEKGEIFPVNYHGSAHIHALSSAHGIVYIEKGIDLIKKGELVHVRQI